MRIVVLSGSPHKNGASATLVDCFMEGAKEAGHEVTRFDCAYLDVHPCIACGKCRSGENEKCVFQDDMVKVNEAILAADAIVFASPIYYFALSAQLKTVIDRFFGNNEALRVKKKTALLIAMADGACVAEPAIATYRICAQYMNWEDCGMVVAADTPMPMMLEGKPYKEQAYQLGKNL